MPPRAKVVPTETRNNEGRAAIRSKRSSGTRGTGSLTGPQHRHCLLDDRSLSISWNHWVRAAVHQQEALLRQQVHRLTEPAKNTDWTQNQWDLHQNRNQNLQLVSSAGPMALLISARTLHWPESEPDQVQTRTFLLEVHPLLVKTLPACRNSQQIQNHHQRRNPNRTTLACRS